MEKHEKFFFPFLNDIKTNNVCTTVHLVIKQKSEEDKVKIKKILVKIIALDVHPGSRSVLIKKILDMDPG